MGTDRVMFSLDWPYECADEAVAWARAVPLGAEDRARFLGGNARELLRL
jgi:predicted TIM-barrel fold metal-dependent hydrolase